MSTLQPPAPHDAALLLPWYLNGTLAESENREVAAHLDECAACRGELESIREVRQQAREIFASPAVPTRLHPEVMSRVKEQALQRWQPGFTPSQSASTPGSRRPPRPTGARTLLQSLADVLQGMRTPRWVAALAVSIIVVQAGALSWFALKESAEPQVRSRAVEAMPARIRIVFNPRATEEEIRAALTALGGRIVDGPVQDGAYVIELPAVEPTVLSQRLRELRQRPGLVERIENAAP
jgi:anti-sigma factor RsiW